MIICLAAVLAIVAGGAAYIYLRDVQNRAYHNAALTTVYVVQGDIARGTPAARAVGDNLVKQAKIPEQFKPVDAVADLATLQGEVAVANLVPGEVVSDSLFVSPASPLATTAEAVPQGDVAVTVSVGTVQDVAGLVQPGDLVDVLVLLQGNTERFLYQDVRVLAVGTTVATPATSAPQVVSATPTTSPPPTTSGLVTFAVPPVAAERLAYIQSGGAGVVSGSLYFALVSPNNKPTSQPAINARDLIPATVTPS